MKKLFFITIILLAVLIPSLLFIISNKSATKGIKADTNNTKQVSEGDSQKTKIKIGLNLVAIDAFPLFVAQEKGYFAQNGLDVNLKQIQPDTSVQALLSKGIDYSSFAKEAVAASQNGVPIKVVMVYSNSSGLALITQPGLKITDIKKIAVAFLLSPPHYQALKFASDNGLSVEVIASGTNPEATIGALLRNKQADAAVQSVVTALRLQNRGYTLMKTFDDGFPQGLVATDDKIKNNSDEVRRVVLSISSASKFIENNPEETKLLLLSFFKMANTQADQKIAEETYPVIKNALSETDTPSQESVDFLIKLGKAGAFKTLEDITKQTVSEPDISKSFDFSL